MEPQQRMMQLPPTDPVDVEAGHVQAQFQLGVCYGKSEGVAVDMVQAVQFYRLAAEQGHAQAQRNLGCYRYGRGVAGDMEQAARFYWMAAQQGHVQAHSQLPGLLVEASENGLLPVVDGLLAVPGVDATAQDNAAIILAAANGHVAVVDRLLAVLMPLQDIIPPSFKHLQTVIWLWWIVY
eukprot:TRINITY_DN8474_c0_g1_i1.p1 TRINITY_DN8474_c0_g1~~TRINITY_DN8474_c0_g1_i1.p1  ORF type:complete len:180 (-),score=41.08 TRINITY_DN8474_c0_g1_i1:828-1367(-)